MGRVAWPKLVHSKLCQLSIRGHHWAVSSSNLRQVSYHNVNVDFCTWDMMPVHLGKTIIEDFASYYNNVVYYLNLTCVVRVCFYINLLCRNATTSIAGGDANGLVLWSSVFN